jgi:hypothetical protein
MAHPIPTVDDLLASTHIWNSIHRWPAEGGAIEITTAELRQVLEDAYDLTMPNWPAMVEIKDA